MSALEQATLIGQRAELRRNIAKRIVYAPYAPDADHIGNGFSASAETRLVVLNFCAGIDFPVGARHWFDLTIAAQDVLSKVLNSVAWLSGSKRFDKRTGAGGGAGGGSNRGAHTFGEQQPDKEDVPVRFDVAYKVETIPEEAVRPDAAPRCAGFRLWIIIKPLAPNAAAQALLSMNNDSGEDMDGNGGGGGGGASAASVAAKRRAQAYQEQRAKWLASPVAMGSGLSCSEARSLSGHVGSLRKRSKISVPEPGTLRPYRFAKYGTSDLFHVAAVQPFFQTYDKADMPDDDFDEFLQTNVIGRPAGPATHPSSPHNLDRIFTKERAMVYKTCGGEYAWKVSHCRLDSYIPGASGRVDENAVDMGGRLPLRAYLQDITTQASPLYIDTASLTFPTPSLVYAIDRVATLSEVFIPFTMLPWAIGAELPREAFEPAADGADPPSLLPDSRNLERLEAQLDAVVRLQAIEDLHNSPAVGGVVPFNADAAGGAASEDGIPEREAMRTRAVPGKQIIQGVNIEVPTLAQAQRRLEASQTPRRLQLPATPSRTDPDMLLIDQLISGIDDMGQSSQIDGAAAAPLTEIPRAKKRIFDEQMTFVKAHYHRTHNEFAQRLYDEFNVEGHALIGWVSSHSSISSEDLVLAAPTSVPGYTESRILEQLNQHAEASSTRELPITTEMKSRVMEKIDVIPSYFVERNDFLAERSKNQIKYGLIHERHAAELAAARTRTESVREVTPLPMLARQDQEKRGLLDSCWVALFALIQKTDNAPPACLQARDRAQHLMSQSLRDCDVNSIVDGTSFAQLMQFLADSFVSVDPVSAQNMPYLMRIFICGFHAHRYQPNRADPALNYLIAGGTGTGKSYLLRRVASYALDGIVQQTTVATTASYNVAQDFDHTMILYEEMESDLLKKPKHNENGNTDKINYAKARMTSFCTWTQYFYSNPDTGKREAHKAVSSQHVVMLAATNQSLDDMDEPMRRRMIVDFVFEISAHTDGGKAQDNERWSVFLQNAIGKQTQHKHLELHWAYMVVELAIRASVIDDVLDDAGRMQLRNILGEAARTQQILTTHTTRSHWVLEAARTLAILDACYNALYAVDKILVYESAESNIKRGSPQMFARVVTPKLHISKAHIMYALMMFDFFYASRDDQRLLGTLAESVCHMSDPSQWTFRRLPTGPNGAAEIDPNYLIVKATTDEKILMRISDSHKHIAQPRPEDIKALLMPYQKIQSESRGMEAVLDNSGKVAHVRRSQTAPIIARQALFFEYDQTNVSATRSVRQLCVSFEFIEGRYDLDFETAASVDIRTALTPQDAVYKANFFADDAHGGSEASRRQGMNIARALARCGDKRGPMVGPIRRTLSSPVFNKHPYEHSLYMPPDRECALFPAFYSPDDVRVLYDDRQPPLRIPQQGVQMILELQRDRERQNMRYDNYSKPLPTAQGSIFGLTDVFDPDGKTPANGTAGDGGAPDMSRGFVTDTYDIDFDIAVEQMRKYAEAGIPLLETFYIEQCRIECGGVETPGKWERVLRRVPELRKLVEAHQPGAANLHLVPLPFNFEPIAYRIRKYARKKFLERFGRPDKATVDYSALNIFARVQDSVIRRLAIIQKTPGVFESYTTKIGHATLFDTPLDGPESGDDDEDERDEEDEGDGAATSRRIIRRPSAPSTPNPTVLSRKRAYEWQTEHRQRQVVARRDAGDTANAALLRLPSPPRQDDTDAMDIDAPQAEGRDIDIDYF